MDNGGSATMHLDYLRPLTASGHGDDRLRVSGTRGIVDIENVILVGGATHLYHDAVKARFPNLEVHTGGNPVFANVRGFQMLGEQWLRSNQSR